MPAQPDISIIIPCRNEKRHIVKCMDSIFASDYPSDKITVYVCDGMSNDGTDEEIRKISSNHANVILLKNKEKHTPHALNLGFSRAKTRIKIRLDAHAEIYPDYLTKCVEVLETMDKAGCAGGQIINVNDTTTGKCISGAMSSRFGVGNAVFRTGGRAGFVDTVPFGAYKDEVFQKAGLFDEDLLRNQDDEFNFRVAKAGYGIYFDPGIKARYYVRSTFGRLFRQFFQYGYWKVYVNKKHKTITTFRQVIPFLFVLFVLSGGLLSFLEPEFGKVYAGVLGLYLMAAVWSACILPSKGCILSTVLAFVLMHVGYGLGYLQGTIHFIVLNKKAGSQFAATTR